MPLENNTPLIIGIGAVTGGVSSLKALTEKLPSNFNAVLVLIQYSENGQQNSLLDFFKSHRPDLNIQVVTGETVPVNGNVYLNAPSANLVVENGLFKPQIFSDYNHQLPLDLFFSSLAKDFKEYSIAVVLSGTGIDGLRGAQCIHAAGGTVIVQNPDNTSRSDVTQSIITAGLADKILEIEQIVPEILKIRQMCALINPGIEGLTEPAHFDTPVQRAQEFLLESFTPAAVGIDSQFEIFYRSGPTHQFLINQKGPQTSNLLDYFNESIRLRIESAVHKALQVNTAVHLRIIIPWNSCKKPVSVSVCRFDSINNLILVIFRDLKKEDGTIAPEELFQQSEDGALHQLEHELSVTHEDSLRNMEQLKSLNEKLQSSNEELLQTVIDTPGNYHLAYLDKDFNFVRVNKIYARGSGYEPQELIGKNHFDLFPDNENEIIFRRVRDTGIAETYYDKSFTCSGGPEKGITYWDWIISATRDKCGTVDGLVLALTETTQKKKAAEALRISEKRFRQIFENAVSGIAIFGLDGIFQQVNPAFCSMLGCSEEELLNRDFSSLIHPDDLETDLQKVELLINREISFFEIENRYLHKSGHPIWVHKFVSAVNDAEGKPAHILMLVTDITERKLYNDAIKQSRDHFALLANTAGELLQSIEPQKVVESLCNKVMKILDCHVFFNFLIDENSGRLRLNACYGISEEEREKINWLDYGTTVCGCAARDGSDIVVEHFLTASDLRTKLAKFYGIKAYACHPLLAENGRVIGTLSFGTRSREVFSEDDLSLMKAITDQVAVAMDRIQKQRKTELIAVRDEAILNSLTEGLVVVNRNGRFQEMNPAALHLHGFSSKEQMWDQLSNYAKNFELLDMQNNRIPVESWPISKVMRGEKVQDYIVQLHKKNTDTTLIISYNGARVYDHNGNYINMVFTMRDVTVQKLLEVQLRRERELLQTIFNSIPVMLTIYDPGDLTFITNKYLEQVTGWTAEEMKEPDAMAKVYPEPEYRAMVTGFMQSLLPGFKDIIMTGKNGEKVESSWANICLEDGRQVGIGIDIRERKRAEEKLQLAYGRLQTFFDQRIGGIGIVIASDDGKISMANDYFLHLVSYTREEMSAGLVNWQKLTPPDWNYIDKLVLKQIRERGVSDTFEKEYLRRDNTRIPVLITCAEMPGESGDILVFILDITDYKRAETALRRSEERFRKMFERHGAVMLLIETESGIILDANIAATLFYGYTREQLRAMKIHQLAQSSYQMVSEQWHKTIKRKCSMSVTTHKLSDNQIRIVEVYSSPIVIGDRTQLFSIIHDITERRQMEEQLQKNTEELAIANRELEAFSYSVSHDLREPLRAIKGFSDFLLEDYHDKLDENGQRYIHRIISGVARMDSLIDDLLSLSLISRQQMNIQEVDLSRMADTIMEELCQRSLPRTVELEIEKDLKVQGDIRLLNVALTNLLNNAWKYTSKKDRGLIKFGKRQTGEDIVYFIQDNGAGFPMDQIDRLFKPFQRLHTESEFSGTGIGLAIVERVVNRHGGRIWARGELGQGAEFCFTLMTEKR